MEVTSFLIPATKGKDKLFKFQYLKEILHNGTVRSCYRAL